VDGQDVLAVYEVAKEAVERARRGEGPSLIEARTYRYRGHFEGDPQVYRTKEEIQWWKDKDPIKLFEKILLEKNILTEKEASSILEKTKNEVEAAVKFAEEGKWPDKKSLLEDVFSTPTRGVLVWQW
jgi:pyruvate dehydrogenase E1 component alpha subunit